MCRVRGLRDASCIRNEALNEILTMTPMAVLSLVSLVSETSQLFSEQLQLHPIF